jgi:hypothetical protein
LGPELFLNEGTHRLQPSIKIDCGHQALKEVSEDRPLFAPSGFLFTPAEFQILTKVEAGRDGSQLASGNQLSSYLGQFTFRQSRIRRVQEVTDHEPEN